MVKEYLRPVASLVAVTVAAGTSDPDESVTVPENWVVEVWPNEAKQPASSSPIRRRADKLMDRTP